MASSPPILSWAKQVNIQTYNQKVAGAAPTIMVILSSSVVALKGATVDVAIATIPVAARLETMVAVHLERLAIRGIVAETIIIKEDVGLVKINNSPVEVLQVGAVRLVVDAVALEIAPEVPIQKTRKSNYLRVLETKFSWVGLTMP